MTYYCSLAEIISDLELPGVKDEAQIMRFIGAASRFFEQRGGIFIPTTEQRKYDGSDQVDIWVDPLLAITSFDFIDGETTYSLTSADYVLHPANRWWTHGPYTRLEVNWDSSLVGIWFDGQQNVKITGRWGLYEETRATGATVSSQTDSSTALVVDNGAGISPGMIVLIGTEQEAIEATGTPTDSTANLSEDLDNSEEEIDVSSGALLNVGETIRIDFEQMRILAILSNTLLVARGYNGTKRATHTTSTDVYVYRTFTVTRGANGTTAAAHTNAAISRYVAPDDVNYLCRQVAALMVKKAASGFAGKVGNADTGETFYYNEFPNDPIGKIMNGYLGKIIR